ncbi:Uncharacterized protein MCHI_002139 [Candidatus Magnetoovum chiemensis]|nr:Uncharacterized protein MCHI_002139 [Candidatus Magnetoovum chiemensis]
MNTRIKTKQGGRTMSKQITFTFPDNLPEESFNNPKFQKKSKEFIVLELLQEGAISQGKAAELLEISRYDLVDLMNSHNIPVFNYPVEELDKEMGVADKWYKELKNDKKKE